MRYLCHICNERSAEVFYLLPHMRILVCDFCVRKGKQKLIAEDEIENKVFSEWTSTQVESLKAYQSSESFFPFICPRMHELNTTAKGLYCKQCMFKLNWAYDWCLDWSWKLLEPPEVAGDRSKLPPNIPEDSAAVALEEPGQNDLE